MLDVSGYDDARLIAAPAPAGSGADAILAALREGTARSEAGRWIELRGVPLDAIADDAFDASTPRRPACLWTSDMRAARPNAEARRVAGLSASAPRRLEGPWLLPLRAVLPRWTLETWKDRLDVLQDSLIGRGELRVRDLDPDAAEGWRSLDDESLLRLERVEVVLASHGLRRRLIEGARGGGRGRVATTGVLFDLESTPYSAERFAEECALVRGAGLTPIVRGAPIAPG